MLPLYHIWNVNIERGFSSYIEHLEIIESSFLYSIGMNVTVQFKCKINFSRISWRFFHFIVITPCLFTRPSGWMVCPPHTLLKRIVHIIHKLHICNQDMKSARYFQILIRSSKMAAIFIFVWYEYSPRSDRDKGFSPLYSVYHEYPKWNWF